jgi:outer membrane receptor protein involved in Fe transport
MVTPVRHDRSHRTVGSPLLAAAIVIALARSAQASADQGSLEEVVVTANRREQNVADVPYNLSTVSSKELQAAGVVDLQGLAHMLPGVTMPDLGPRANSSNSNIVIRGINATNQGLSFLAPNLADPPVSTYVDDVPLFVNLSVADVARVEVLRGPQGTLYGSGAVGGTVRLIHNLPDSQHLAGEFWTDLSGTQHARNPSYSFGGLLNVPLAENLAIRGNIEYRKLSAFTDALNEAKFDANMQPILPPGANPVTSDQVYGFRRGVDASDSLSGRLSMLWRATERFSALFAYQHQLDNSDGFSGQQTAYAAYTDPATGTSYPGNPGARNATNKYVANEPMTRRVDLGAVTLTGDLGFATVTSSTSYVNNRYNDIVDETSTEENAAKLPFGAYYYGGYPRGTSLLFDFGTDKSFVQEFRLVSPQSSVFDWIAGAFYRHETTHLEDPITIPGLKAWGLLPGSATLYNQYVQAYYAGCPTFATYDQAVAAPAPCGRGGVPPSKLPTDRIYNLIRDTGFHDKALYGELTYHFTDRWQLTGGTRFFWNDFSQSSVQYLPIDGARFSTSGTDPNGSGVSPLQQSSDHNHIWKLNMSYEVSPALRPYATWSEGYRHGGANSFAIGKCIYCELNGNQIPYQPDTARNYELGLKGVVGSWLRYSASAYRVDWRNIQLNTYTLRSSTGVVLNGKDARSQGVELEVTAQATDRLSVTAGYGYTDAKLTNNFIQGFYVGRSGDPLPGVPKQQATLAVDYVEPLREAMSLQLHLDGSYQSSVTSNINNLYVGTSGGCDPANPPSCAITAEPYPTWRTNYRVFGGFTLLNVAAILALNEKLSLRFFVDNVTNNQGITTWTARYSPSIDVPGFNGQPNNLVHPSGANYMDYVMRPRTIGLRLRYRFE